MDGNWATGDWNIAHNPDAWELMFNETPDDNIGLEWEPCHQMVYLIDPLPQIRKWAHKFFHVHGKDATIRWEVIREHGIFGKEKFVFMRTPGFGDSNWTDVISELRLAGYAGSIDIEGWHDPVYRDELEMTGQVRGAQLSQELPRRRLRRLQLTLCGRRSVARRATSSGLAAAKGSIRRRRKLALWEEQMKALPRLALAAASALALMSGTALRAGQDVQHLVVRRRRQRSGHHLDQGARGAQGEPSRRDGQFRAEDVRPDAAVGQHDPQLGRGARHPRIQQGQRDRRSRLQPGPADQSRRGLHGRGLGQDPQRGPARAEPLRRARRLWLGPDLGHLDLWRVRFGVLQHRRVREGRREGADDARGTDGGLRHVQGAGRHAAGAWRRIDQRPAPARLARLHQGRRHLGQELPGSQGAARWCALSLCRADAHRLAGQGLHHQGLDRHERRRCVAAVHLGCSRRSTCRAPGTSATSRPTSRTSSGASS